MLVAIFFSIVVFISMLFVCFLVLHGMMKKYITTIFGMVLIVSSVAIAIWTVSMIYEKVPAIVQGS